LCVGYRNKNTSKDVQPDRLFLKLKLNVLRPMTTVNFKFPDPKTPQTVRVSNQPKHDFSRVRPSAEQHDMSLRKWKSAEKGSL
jgi:hypothetical protein